MPTPGPRIICIRKGPSFASLKVPFTYNISPVVGTAEEEEAGARGLPEPPAAGSPGSSPQGGRHLWERMQGLSLNLHNGLGQAVLMLPDPSPGAAPAPPINWMEDLTPEAWEELRSLQDAVMHGDHDGHGPMLGEEEALAYFHILVLSLYQVRAGYVCVCRTVVQSGCRPCQPCQPSRPWCCRCRDSDHPVEHSSCPH